jgi:SNF2 family DNA or RNA helicase
MKWWLTKYFGDQEHIFHMFAEMGNEERTGMQSKIQDSCNHSVFVMTPKVGWTGLNFTAANHTAVTLKC